MITKAEFKPSSYETNAGKWIPSGTIMYTDSASVIAVEKTYKDSSKNSKKDADDFFVAESTKEFKELQNKAGA